VKPDQLASLLVYAALLAFGVGKAAGWMDWPGVQSVAFALAWVVGCGGAPIVLSALLSMLARAKGAQPH
jgi:hypothetical protein